MAQNVRYRGPTSWVSNQHHPDQILKRERQIDGERKRERERGIRRDRGRDVERDEKRERERERVRKR